MILSLPLYHSQMLNTGRQTLTKFKDFLSLVLISLKYVLVLEIKYA